MKRGWKKYQHYIVPTRGNEHRPHLFSDDSILVLTTVLVFTFAFSIITSVGQFDLSGVANVSSSELVRLANTSRTANARPVLAPNPLLERAAELKLEHMSTHGYFEHTAPDGTTPWHWFRQVGYEFELAGENLAIDFRDSDKVNQAWLNSPTHRDNILNGSFTEIGIAAKKVPFEGRETTIVVQLFGKPPASAIQAPIKKAEETVEPHQQVVVTTATEEPVTVPYPALEEVEESVAASPSQGVALTPREEVIRETDGVNDEEPEVVHESDSLIVARASPEIDNGGVAGVSSKMSEPFGLSPHALLSIFSLASLALAAVVSIVFAFAIIIRPSVQRLSVITHGGAFVCAALSLSYFQLVLSEFLQFS